MSNPDRSTTPDVPLRMELTFEVPGTADQVWEAVATANGISAWFLPTELEGRVGGRVVFHMGESSSEGRVTAFDAPTRIEYEEPDWAALGGHEGAAVTPLVSEFLVEARDGGSCVVRVVSSAFGTGAEWEREFFADMERGWMPFFDNLRLYLTEFPGQRVTHLSVDTQLDGRAVDVYAALRTQLGTTAVGDRVAARGVEGRVQRINEHHPLHEMLVRVEDPLPGFLQFMVYAMEETRSLVQLEAYLFSDRAADYVEREQGNWKAFFDDLAVHAS